MSVRNECSPMGEPAGIVADIASGRRDSMGAARAGSRAIRDMDATNRTDAINLITITAPIAARARVKDLSRSAIRSLWEARAEQVRAGAVCDAATTTIGGRQGWPRQIAADLCISDRADRSLSLGNRDEIR